MSVLRKYVRNRYRPEGCMVEGWSTEEAIKFCTYYLGLNRIGVHVSRHEKGYKAEGRLGKGQYELRLMLFGKLISPSFAKQA
jgi:hypothetical protein